MLRREPASQDRTAATTTASSCDWAMVTTSAPSAAASTARSWRSVARARHLHRVDFEFQKLAAQLTGALGDTLRIGAVAGHHADIQPGGLTAHSDPRLCR